MTFKDIFAGISSASTAMAVYGLASQFIGDGVLINAVAIGLSIFIGYSISFYIQRQLEEHEKFSAMILVSLLLSATYTTNSRYITSIIDNDIENKIFNEENSILKSNNIYQKNIITLKENKYDEKLKKKIELEKRLDKLKTLDTQYRLKEYINELEAFRKEYTDTPNKTFSKWWKRVGKVSGCYQIYSKPKRIECVALYRAKNYRRNKVLLISVKASIDEVEKQLKTLSSIMKYNDEIKKGVHSKIEKKYQDKMVNETRVKLVLFLIGFFFEGILLFELWLRLGKRKKEAKRSMELANIDSNNNDEVEITPFDIIKMYAKNKNNKSNPLHTLLVRTSKGKQKYNAIPNALIGAFYYSYIFSVPLQDVTQANIRFVNGKDRQSIRETFSAYGETFYALGSTSNVTTYKGKRISPQKVALNYIRKNNISNDISLEMFFYVVEGFIENVDKYL